jgi:hypothetical protein
MGFFLQATGVLLLFLLVRAGDLAITAAQGRDTLRAICYGVVAVLALVVIILALLGRGV